jgi:hypothetical protein
MIHVVAGYPGFGAAEGQGEGGIDHRPAAVTDESGHRHG